MAVKERVTVSGKTLVEKVKDLVHQGNIRRVRLIHEGEPLIDIPLSIGAPAAAVAVLAAPLLAALAAFALWLKNALSKLKR